MVDEKNKQRPKFNVDRSWSIDINDDITVEATPDGEGLTFLSEADDTENSKVLFTLSFEEFDAIYETVGGERARIKALEATKVEKKA